MEHPMADVDRDIFAFPGMFDGFDGPTPEWVIGFGIFDRSNKKFASFAKLREWYWDKIMLVRECHETYQELKNRQQMLS